MNRLAFALALALLTAAAFGCGDECMVAGQCAMGQYCDFDQHVCVSDCTSDSDCGAHATCDPEHGICQPMDIPSITRTSTAGDASVTGATDLADAATGD